MLLDTPVCEFGWQAPDFALEDAEGTKHSMRGHLTPKGLIIAFICNHCPYVKRIAPRLSEDFDLLQANGIGVLAVMPNDVRQSPEDSPGNMRLFAHAHGFAFPYLLDADQSVARRYGAVCTPDFFGFNGKGELQYRGHFENPMSGKRDLLEAMQGIAGTGRGPRDQTASMGCSIKWRDG